jgi:hypothetical protein
MKELNLEQMENLSAGNVYCDTLENWIMNDFEGYQGNPQDVLNLWGHYCASGN